MSVTKPDAGRAGLGFTVKTLIEDGYDMVPGNKIMFVLWARVSDGLRSATSIC